MKGVQDKLGMEYNELTSLLILGLLIALSIAGIVINAVLLRMLGRMSEKSTSFSIIRNMSISDLLLCSVTLLICIFRLVLGFPGAYRSSLYCPVLGSMSLFFSSMSGILMSLLAMERYSVICHQQGLPHRAIWGVFSAIALMFAILLIGSSMLGVFSPEPGFIFCMPNGSRWSINTRMAFNVLLNIPILVLMFCYVSIFIRCYRSPLTKSDDSLTRKAAIRSLVFLAIFVICYIPKSTTFVIGAYSGFGASPPILYLLIPIAITLLAIINPALVLLLHRHIKGVVDEIAYCDKSHLFPTE
ncbi:G-protein coupled receptor 35 [Entomophthora muscae]|uniref:G-protein coupled receptor 35 n=1 Tax=Entomophthora muscae TaxID=34485 RepID=A0ACC2SWY3_9FUNG|nr:G-protein coupled receptor 35 [Entomophthora muscae]